MSILGKRKRTLGLLSLPNEIIARILRRLTPCAIPWGSQYELNEMAPMLVGFYFAMPKGRFGGLRNFISLVMPSYADWTSLYYGALPDLLLSAEFSVATRVLKMICFFPGRQYGVGFDCTAKRSFTQPIAELLQLVQLPSIQRAITCLRVNTIGKGMFVPLNIDIAQLTNVTCVKIMKHAEFGRKDVKHLAEALRQLPATDITLACRNLQHLHSMLEEKEPMPCVSTIAMRQEEFETYNGISYPTPWMLDRTFSNFKRLEVYPSVRTNIGACMYKCEGPFVTSEKLLELQGPFKPSHILHRNAQLPLNIRKIALVYRDSTIFDNADARALTTFNGHSIERNNRSIPVQTIF